MIPPFVDEAVEQNGTPERREAARRRLRLSAMMRARRAAITHPFAPSPGVLSRKTFDAQSKESLPGLLVRSEGDPPSGDAALDEAHAGAGDTWTLYHRFFQRDSIDDAGLVLVSTVHYGERFDNAFWDGDQMVYGDGDIFGRFTSDPTVIGHELAHGVTQYAAALIYQGQPGELNEHVSDVFGAIMEQYVKGQTVDRADWLIGAELFAGRGLQGRALRDMRNPGTAYDDPLIGKDPQPAHMDQLYTGWSDNGGVHINSGIPNRAYALAALEYGGLAWESIGPIWYRVLTMPMIPPNATFQQFADATLQATAYYGRDVLPLINAWEAVGIRVGQADPPVPIPSPKPSKPLFANPLVRAFLAEPEIARALHCLDREARKLQQRDEPNSLLWHGWKKYDP